MQRICTILGWVLLSALLLSGGLMSVLILTDAPFWTEEPLRRHFIPLGHAHAGVLGIIMLLYGVYLGRVALSARAKGIAAALYIVGALTLPGGFLAAALMGSPLGPGLLFIAVPLGGALVVASFVMMAIGMARAAPPPGDAKLDLRKLFGGHAVLVGFVAGALGLVATFMACTLGAQRRAQNTIHWSSFNPLIQRAPEPGPPSYPGGTLTPAEHMQWVAWGEQWFRTETFGNEKIWTDIIGILNGSIDVPDGKGGYRAEPFFKYFVQAIDELDGVRGNLYSGNGGPDGNGYTSDLVITLPKGALLDKTFPIPEKLHTGLDVEAGSPWPLGMVAIEAPDSDRGLPYLLDPSRFSDGPLGVGPVPRGARFRVGISCALCHYSLDLDWDGKADLKSPRPNRPTANSPYSPRQSWALGNQDLHLGWLNALAKNTLGNFANGAVVPRLGPADRPSSSAALEYALWIKANYKNNYEQVERTVDQGFLLAPRGAADDTPDGLANPIQFPVLFTYKNWPFNFDGVMLNASDRNNNVWTNGLDPTDLVSLCSDRVGKFARLLPGREKGLFDALTAEEYADIIISHSPAMEHEPSVAERLKEDILGYLDGIPGLLRPDSMVLIRGVPGALPGRVLHHPLNVRFGRVRDPKSFGPDYGRRGPMIGLLGTRVITPPEIRKALGLDRIERQYGLKADEFLSEAVSLMLDWAEPPANLSRLAERARGEALPPKGYQVFQRERCDRCHAGPLFTNNTIVPLDDLKTSDARALATEGIRFFLAPRFDPSTGEALPRGPCGALCKLLGGEPPGYKVVTLRYLWGSAPYLHDGGVAVALRPESTPVGDDLRLLLSRPERDKIYGIGQILTERESNPERHVRADAALSLQALLLKTERDKVIAANRTPSLRVPGEARSIAARSVNIEGIGHEWWINDSPGGEEITALVAFLLNLDRPLTQYSMSGR